ncbi:hypothetical protein B9Z55_012802 [Caenorhabditis nigoni]|uniref:F-box associated domain-containing protein n=1 Tax=Caenorhabditis nigoni TaxID=1611254 RepID=A0A2G5TYW9_9PELO|nr:hypothetical protein B9Z55_012802 [Caenorhabditis nigoni]
MASVIENLTDKTEKLPTDPIYDTNWCDMPAEIKLECIGKMEFKERVQCMYLFNVFPLLRKIKNGVESIMIEQVGSSTIRDIDKFLAVSHIQNVPYWHIEDYDQSDSLHKVAQMWIDKNSKIGTTFQVSVNRYGSFWLFSEHFSDRFVSNNDKRVRIRTNNPDRHILLERGLDDEEFLSVDYFRLKVISAKTKESEYDENYKKWIRKIKPNRDYWNFF